jgi:hypothetical protein
VGELSSYLDRVEINSGLASHLVPLNSGLAAIAIAS